MKEFVEISEEQKKSIEIDMSNAVYQAVVGIFETQEYAGHTFGNGHHAAQKVCQMAIDELKSRWYVERRVDESTEKAIKPLNCNVCKDAKEIYSPNEGMISCLACEEQLIKHRQ